MCQALRVRQLAGHPRKIGNTLLKSGPFPGPQNFSSQATGCRPLPYSVGRGFGAGKSVQLSSLMGSNVGRQWASSNFQDGDSTLLMARGIYGLQ